MTEEEDHDRRMLVVGTYRFVLLPELWIQPRLTAELVIDLVRRNQESDDPNPEIDIGRHLDPCREIPLLENGPGNTDLHPEQQVNRVSEQLIARQR